MLLYIVLFCWKSPERCRQYVVRCIVAAQRVVAGRGQRDAVASCSMHCCRSACCCWKRTERCRSQLFDALLPLSVLLLEEDREMPLSTVVRCIVAAQRVVAGRGQRDAVTVVVRWHCCRSACCCWKRTERCRCCCLMHLHFVFLIEKYSRNIFLYHFYSNSDSL